MVYDQGSLQSVNYPDFICEKCNSFYYLELNF